MTVSRNSAGGGTTINRAEKAGYPIRVALIAQPSDLGAVSNLWGKPREYVRFLDIELQFIYKGPLLVVMPDGLGFAYYHHRTASDYQPWCRSRPQADATVWQ